MKLEIHLIRTDGGTQNRVNGINSEIVDEYAESIQAGAKFPPVEVYYDGTHYWLTDGFHRVTGYKKLGLVEIEAIVHNGSQREAQWASFGVNKDHGLRKSQADKRFAVTKALDDMEYFEYSDRKIADHVGVSHTYVSKLRKESSDYKPSVKTIERNGAPVKMETKNIGKNEEKKSEEYNPEDDRISELAELNEQLIEENSIFKNKELLLSGDQEAVYQKLDDAEKRIKQLEAELNVVKLSRDQLQNKNAELIKQVNYWRKRVEK